MKVMLVGSFDPEFKRNRRIHDFLLARGHETVVCNVRLWGSDRSSLAGNVGMKILVGLILAQLRLLVRFLRLGRADLVLVQYPGWFDMLVIGPLARLRRMPVLFDPFISLSDTVVSDRALVSADGVAARVLRLIDRLSLRCATRVLADTPEHAEFYASLSGIERSRIGVVWVGADDEVFRTVELLRSRSHRVLFYGTYIPLHGIETIIEAAGLLQADGLEFRVIGDGQERPAIEAALERSGASNIELVAPMPVESLVQEIAEATICLGVFGTSDKAARVVPNKVFECVAVGRPVVTGDTPAIRRAFPAGALGLVPTGDPESLADEIRRLIADPDRRAQMVAMAGAHYASSYSTTQLVELLDEELGRTVATQSGLRPLRGHDVCGH